MFAAFSCGRINLVARRQNPRAGFDGRDFDGERAEMRRTLVGLSTAAALIAGPGTITAAPLGETGQSMGIDPCGYYYGIYPY
jgi:hypothetical protein